MVYPLKRRAVRLVGLAAVLAGVAAVEFVAGPFFVPTPQRSMPGLDALEDPETITPAEKLDISAFSEVIERPLFARSRRPSPPIEPVAKTAPKAENFDLVGIIISPSGRVALLRPKRSDDVLRAVEGQQVGGWKIREINSTEITLERGDFSELLKINDTQRERVVPKHQATRAKEIRAAKPAKK
jgi:hypothetical protein